jgi:hypothetical protein
LKRAATADIAVSITASNAHGNTTLDGKGEHDDTAIAAVLECGGAKRKAN